MIRWAPLAIVLILAAVLHSAPARADCTLTQNGQTRPPGTLIYESANNLVLYCADTVWKALVFNAGGGGAECPASTAINGYNPAGNYYFDVWKEGNYIYTAENDSSNNGLISAFTFDGTAWTHIDSENLGSTETVNNVWSDGTYIYLAQGTSGVRALSFNGTAFTLIDTFDTAGTATDVWGDGTYIYVADDTNGLVALTFNGTVFAPATGVIGTSTYDSPNTAYSIWGDGTYIYLADDDTTRALTFNGTAWTFINAYDNPNIAVSVWGDGTYIYVSEAFSGIRALSFDGANWTSLALEDGTLTDGKIHAQGGYIYISGQAAAALTFDGTDFSVKGYYPAYPNASGVFSDGTYIYVTGEFGGINAYAGCTGGGGGAEPACTDDDTATCTLDATRDSGDPEFIAANIASGVNILGVTGTLTAGSGCSAFTYDFNDLTDVAKSALQTSNIVQITTNSCSGAPVSATGDGSPQYRVCSDAACTGVVHDWAGSGNTIDNAEYLQLRLTTAGTGNTASVAVSSIGGALANWSVTTVPDNYKVFVTSATYTGNLGGIGGADKKCRDLAAAASLPGVYKAWISEENAALDPQSRFTQGSLAYYLTNGTKVADNWADLVNGSLDNPINVDQNGATVSTSTAVWTNTYDDGSMDSFTACDQWILTASTATAGLLTSATSTWTKNSTLACSGSRRLYCFQQADDPVGSHKKIFITSTAYNGNLGGLAGADTKCQTAADSQSLGGTYKAWISGESGGTSAASRLAHASVPYRMVDGTRIADDWTDLVDSTLDTGIVLDEAGGESLNVDVWTNTYEDGSMDSFSGGCTDWTVGTSGGSGGYGRTGIADLEWTNYNTKTCNNTARLICVEQ